MRRLISSLVLAAFAASTAAAQAVDQGAANAPFAPEWPTQTRAPALSSGFDLSLEVIAEGLERPWGIAVLPDGSYLVTERPGRLRRVTKGGVGAPIEGVPEVDARRQGGLLDVTLAPDFAQSRVIYLTYAKPLGGGKTATAALRARLSEDGTALSEVADIFVQDPPSQNPMHFGSRIVNGQNGTLFITTGEHFSERERQFAQDVDKTYGKIVRITPGGGPAPGNPFAGQGGASAEVWSLGHRNIQGAARRPGTDEFWAVEHGPRGGDELNLIEKGANYGWPIVSYGINYSGRVVGSGEARGAGFAPPRYYWDPVIAPGGMVFYRGDMFSEWSGNVLIGSLNPGGLVRLVLDGDRVVGEERFFDGAFRLRDVSLDRDGALLLLDDSNGRVLRAVRR